MKKTIENTIATVVLAAIVTTLIYTATIAGKKKTIDRSVCLTTLMK